MRALMTLTLSIGCVLPAVADEPTEQRLVTNKGRFEITFPVAPVLKQLPQGDEIIQVASTERKMLDEIAYSCHWYVMAEPPQGKQAVADHLDGFVEGGVKGSNGKLLEDKKIAAGDFPGRQFILELDDQNTILKRVYVAGDRVISVGTMGRNRDAVTGAAAMRFLDSLKIRG